MAGRDRGQGDVAVGDGDRAGMDRRLRGGCPRRWPGPGWWSFHIAAASWERAELWVHTNTTPLRRERARRG